MTKRRIIKAEDYEWASLFGLKAILDYGRCHDVQGDISDVCWEPPGHEGRHKCWESRFPTSPCKVEWK